MRAARADPGPALLVATDSLPTGHRLPLRHHPAMPASVDRCGRPGRTFGARLMEVGLPRPPVFPQREEKRRALTRFGIGPNAAAVLAHDALHRRQADASPWKLVARVKALEQAEHLLGESHVESGAVVAHEKMGLAVFSTRAEF